MQFMEGFLAFEGLCELTARRMLSGRHAKLDCDASR